jgi:hypothetical protein
MLTTAIPITLPKEKFSIIPDWLASRSELTQGYKLFYSTVARRIGSRGYAYLSAEQLAKDLSLCTRTISNYIKISRENNLLMIVPTGRSPIFILLWHPWMGIPIDDITSLKISLPEKFADLIRKIFPSESPQTLTNQQITSEQNQLETILTEPIKDKEANRATSIVLGTTEEKDLSLALTNQQAPEAPAQPAIENQHPANLPDQQPQPQQPQIEPQPKGKFSFEQYLEFAQNEAKRGKKIFSVEGLAKHLLKTGSQDSQVARFLKVNLDSQKLKNSSLTGCNSEQSLSKEEIERRKMIAIGKEIFEGLEDWEQAELQDEKLEGADFFFTCSMTVQNALLEAIRQDIYLELAEMN